MTKKDNMNNLDLSIIILSYNTKDITDICLNKLQLSVVRCQTKLKNNIEVIVLDNASSDGSVSLIKKKYPRVKLIESKENTGYSKGNNIAFKKAKHPVILFLNSDVFVEDDTLIKALEYFGRQCDVLGVKLTYEDNKLQPSAGNLPDPLNTIFWILGMGQLFNPFHPKNKEFFSKNRQVDWVTGAFFMVKKEIFKKVNGFDESIFMYMDEVDLCKRINKLGFRICFTPSISVVHLLRASSKDNQEKAFTSELKGIKVYFRKYFANSYFLVRLFLILGLILRIIAFSILGKTKRARVYMEGLSVV